MQPSHTLSVDLPFWEMVECPSIQAVRGSGMVVGVGDQVPRHVPRRALGDLYNGTVAGE